MIRPLLFALGLAATACGPNGAEQPSFPIELYVSAGLLDEISSFQLSLVTFGASLDCVAVQKSCIKEQIDASRFVKLRDDSGKSVESLSFPIALTAGVPNTRRLAQNVPLGRTWR